jgi:hypothetical protein
MSKILKQTPPSRATNLVARALFYLCGLPTLRTATDWQSRRALYSYPGRSLAVYPAPTKNPAGDR